MGKASRDKGARGERAAADLFRKHEFDTTRIGEWKENDLIVDFFGDKKIVEVKVRARGCGSSLIYEALQHGFAVMHKADRHPFLITFDADEFCEFVRWVYREGCKDNED